MKCYLALAVLTVFTLTSTICAQNEPELAKTKEKLSAAEGKAIRHAIVTEGPRDASPDYKRPYPRVLIVPKDVAATYAKKPEATVRLLLKIVEGGEPLASLHASACIHALVWGPQFGWMATHVDRKTWDDPQGVDGETWREHMYDVCVSLIAKKEKARAEKSPK